MISRPGWATIIGSFMLLFGGCGTVNSLKWIKTEKMLDKSNKVLDNIEFETETAEIDSADLKVLDILSDSLVTDSTTNAIDLKSTIQNMLHMTDHFKKWIVILGWMGLFISLLYFITGYYFFKRRKHTIQLGIATIIISLLYAAFKVYILSGDTSSEMMLAGMNFQSYFSMFVDFVLLTIILVGDKDYFNEVEYYTD